MAAETRDPLARALDGLRDDLRATPLAPASQVRHRGDVRQRQRRVGLAVTSVAAVAAVAFGAGQLMEPVGTPRPAPPASGSLDVTGGPSSSGTSSPTVSVPADRSVVRLKPASPGGGTVPAAYFLPGPQWRGADLNRGHAMVSAEPTETEGSVTRFACDPDTSIQGDVAFLQVQERNGTMVATQKVRLLADDAAATAAAATFADRIPRCQDALRAQAIKDSASLPAGETAPVPNAEVVESTTAAVDDETGSVRIWRTTSDYGTGAGSSLVEWVVLAREGSAITFLSLPQFETSSVSVAALTRVADEARLQMRFAASR
ncbi:hypothetical protein GCM10027446_11790 [Angustibacter peucedani]